LEITSLCERKLNFCIFEIIVNNTRLNIYRKSAHWFEDVQLIYKWYHDVLLKKENKEAPVEQDKDTYIKNGFVQHDMECFKIVNYEKNEWNYIEKQFNVFNEIIELLKDSNQPYIIIQAPITNNSYSSYTNNNVLDEFMIKKGEYYNFNNLIKLNDSLHFLDANHLNQNGVELYNKKLIEVTKMQNRIQ
jgi:hypothetical protein